MSGKEVPNGPTADGDGGISVLFSSDKIWSRTTADGSLVSERTLSWRAGDPDSSLGPGSGFTPVILVSDPTLGKSHLLSGP